MDSGLETAVDIGENEVKEALLLSPHFSGLKYKNVDLLDLYLKIPYSMAANLDSRYKGREIVLDPKFRSRMVSAIVDVLDDFLKVKGKIHYDLAKSAINAVHSAVYIEDRESPTYSHVHDKLYAQFSLKIADEVVNELRSIDQKNSQMFNLRKAASRRIHNINSQPIIVESYSV